MKVILIICALLFISGCNTFKGFKLWAPELFGMEQISEHIYADDKMTESQRQEFVQAVHAAKKRLPAYFDEVMSAPDIFACSTEECFQRVGGYSVIKRVPAWFNEGLAVVVTGEPSHSEKVWEKIENAGILTPPLNELPGF